MKALRKRRFDSDASDQEFSVYNDYIKQGDPKTPSSIYNEMNAEDINEDKIIELQKIADYCHTKKLSCIYAHGPIVEDVCLNSQNYIRAINEIIHSTGLMIASSKPVCISRPKLGDSTDHVHPAFKDEYTKKYFELLKPMLCPSNCVLQN